MAVRQTSIETYRKITENGLLSTRRTQVYAALYRRGPASASALAANTELPHLEMARNDISARLTELTRAGCVQETGTETDPLTGRDVLIFDVTPHLPRNPNPPKRKSRAALIFEVREAQAEGVEWRDRYNLLRKVCRRYQMPATIDTAEKMARWLDERLAGAHGQMRMF